MSLKNEHQNLRIDVHPILGKDDRETWVNIFFDGKKLKAKKVQLKPEYNRTAVITVIIPQKYAHEVRNIANKYDGCESDSYREKSCSESENSYGEKVALELEDDAILDGARSIKGIKNRTGAGMGLCQGRTCSNLIVKKLNKYLDSKEILPDKKRMPLRPVKINNFLENDKNVR